MRVRLPLPAQLGGIIKKSINESFFAEWSSDMAYILGYIAADGCLIKRSNRINSWILNITSKDFEHLKKINLALGSDYLIGRKTNGLIDHYFQLQISNKVICQQLLDLGITTNKTLSLQPLSVPDYYFGDYVRGYFDADGSVYIYMVNNCWQIKSQICSASRQFLEELTDKLTLTLKIPCKTIYRNRPQGKKNLMYKNAFYINDSEKLFNFLYGNQPNLYLERKYKVFEKWQRKL